MVTGSKMPYINGKPIRMRYQLILIYLAVFPACLVGQECPAPEIIQILPYQRAAQIVLFNIGEEVDSVKIFLGGPAFRNPLTDQADTVFTFRGNLPYRGYNLYDLQPKRNYLPIARSYCDGVPSAFSNFQLFRTDTTGRPPGNSRTKKNILAGAALRCSYRPGTTRDATGPDVGEEPCAGVADDDVWYNLRAFYQGYRLTVRPIAGSDPDLVMQIYDDSGALLACIDAGGESESETFQLQNLEKNSEIDIRVFTKGEGGYCDFEICTEGIAARPIALGAGCTEVPATTVDGRGRVGEFVDVLDSTGALVASIENTQPLGTVRTSFYLHSGDIRVTNQTQARYARRNVSLRPANEPDTAVAVRLYFTEAEVNELVLLGAISGVDGLGVTKVAEAICSEFFSGAGEEVTFRRAGRYGDGFFVEVGVAGFSEFFIHPAAEAMTVTTSGEPVRAASAGWQLAPVPFTDHLRLSVPDHLRESPVSVVVMDVNGRQVQRTFHAAASHHDLQTSSWPTGIYLLRMSSGGRDYVARVVK